jgi:hypothetical protein
MKDYLIEKYRKFLVAKYERGNIEAIYDRLTRQQRVSAFQHVFGMIMETKGPEDDKEFMSRVGEEAIRLHDKQERKKQSE